MKLPDNKPLKDQSIAERAKKEADRFAYACDGGCYINVYFNTESDKKKFCKYIGVKVADYIDGTKLPDVKVKRGVAKFNIPDADPEWELEEEYGTYAEFFLDLFDNYLGGLVQVKEKPSIFLIFPTMDKAMEFSRSSNWGGRLGQRFVDGSRFLEMMKDA